MLRLVLVVDQSVSLVNKKELVVGKQRLQLKLLKHVMNILKKQEFIFQSALTVGSFMITI